MRCQAHTAEIWGSMSRATIPDSMLLTQLITHECAQAGPRVSGGLSGDQVPKDGSMSENNARLPSWFLPVLVLALKDSASASHCLLGVDRPLCSEALCPHGNSSFLLVSSVTKAPGGDEYACMSVCLDVHVFPEQAPIVSLPKVHSLLSIPH